MAFAAELDHWFAHQGLVLRGMWVMTGQTAILAYHWPMYPVFIKGLVEHLVVTTAAQTDAFFFGL